MFHLNVILTLNAEQDAPEISQLLQQAAELSRQEAGCRRFEVYHSQSDPKVFLLSEWWETEEHWQAHKQERAVTEIYLPKVLPKVTRVPHFSNLISP